LVYRGTHIFNHGYWKSVCNRVQGGTEDGCVVDGHFGSGSEGVIQWELEGTGAAFNLYFRVSDFVARNHVAAWWSDIIPQENSHELYHTPPVGDRQPAPNTCWQNARLSDNSLTWWWDEHDAYCTHITKNDEDFGVIMREGAVEVTYTVGYPKNPDIRIQLYSDVHTGDCPASAKPGKSEMLGDVDAAKVGAVWCQYKYTVKVVNAKNLPDEESWLQGDNDVYVEVYGYGLNGGSKNYQTKVITSKTPEWNQEFVFDDAESDDDVGRFEYFYFKLYDDDSVFGVDIGWMSSDFLGETEKFDVNDVGDCKEIFSKELAVTRDGEGCGSLFVEITKENCDCNGGGYDDYNDGEEKTEKAKKTMRRLLA